ncbi:hypothetical protein [Cohnella fermenti]|uniref:Uncharacterized protein n=1 Tax=Cohnella fermenti TaxID=2565925 RepID=A0A4S4BEH1_9BACL|nr:hypothetical protein [Cohnella fermenti]THF72465.1 hypothetical protein E6C55_33025 [Cohnella fermenti]
MSELTLGEKFGELNQWYDSLPEEQQDLVIQAISESYKAIIHWLQANAPEIGEIYESLQEQVHEWGKRGSSPYIRSRMSSYKAHPDLAKAMRDIASRTLEPYRNAAYLRKRESDEFEKIVTLIIMDNYVERRFNSYYYCDEYLGISDLPNTRSSYMTVMNLVEQHYERLDTLEELGEFMEEELSFSVEKIDIFLKLLIEYREDLDRFMLFRKLKRLEQAMLRLEVPLSL